MCARVDWPTLAVPHALSVSPGLPDCPRAADRLPRRVSLPGRGATATFDEIQTPGGFCRPSAVVLARIARPVTLSLPPLVVVSPTDNATLSNRVAGFISRGVPGLMTSRPTVASSVTPTPTPTDVGPVGGG